jgi:hypothetical protein
MDETTEGSRRKGIAIGIDPSKGVAIYNRDAKRLMALINTDFWDIIEIIRTHIILGKEFVVVCEAPHLNQPVWHATSNRDRGISSVPMYGKICQNVGMNKQDAKRIIEYCELRKIKIITQRPNARSMTKLDKEMFERITGWDKNSNEHTRDAAMLVFGL